MKAGDMTGKWGAVCDGLGKALLEGHTPYQAIFEDQTEFICSFLPDGTITFANQAFCSYCDKKLEEIIGHRFTANMSEEDRLIVHKKLALLSPDHPVTSYEQKIVDTKGEVHWHQWSNRAIFDNSGKTIEFQTIGRDITVRRRSEKALRESMRRYRAIVEDQIELVCRYLPDCTLTFVNQAYCRAYGKEREELVGRSLLSYLTEEDQKEILEYLKKVDPEHPVTTSIQTIEKSNGDKCWQQWFRRAIYDDTGKLVEIQSVGRDITELKRTEEALRASEATLLEQKAALEQKNVALREILIQIELEKQQVKDDVIANVEDVLLPVLEKLRMSSLNNDAKFIDLIERGLKGLTSSFGRKITQASLKLTRREIDICNMIKNGFSSKEIAEFLYISLYTVGRHRYNIRKKMNIINKKTNLSVFIESL